MKLRALPARLFLNAIRATGVASDSYGSLNLLDTLNRFDIPNNFP
jgi:hypothetical protein